MEIITLTNSRPDGSPLEVSYLPGMGMNMISFKTGGIEAIDQSTKDLFEERYAGLGALIGPHFHHREPLVIPKIKDESLFPHLANLKKKGIQEPFSHGIGRYAPWKAESTKTSVRAILTGKDVWNGVPLSELEGQNFKMVYSANLQPDGLHIEMSVVSDTDSLVGIHYYYRLPNGKGTIISCVEDRYLDQGKMKKIPADWKYNSQKELEFVLDKEADYTFYPSPFPLAGKIVLDTEDYALTTSYTSMSQENAWQLYHPKGASFVCIEPISAQDPRHPNLTVSSIQIHLSMSHKKY